MEFVRNHAREDIPRTWRPIMSIEGKRISASIVCPAGHYGVLTDHSIDNDGAVTPSVVCPEDGCDFHENIKLLGWSEE